jgi:hypothetical protein
VGVNGNGCTPDPPPPHAAKVSARVTASALDANNRPFIYALLPLKPLKYNDFLENPIAHESFHFPEDG